MTDTTAAAVSVTANSRLVRRRCSAMILRWAETAAASGSRAVYTVGDILIDWLCYKIMLQNFALLVGGAAL